MATLLVFSLKSGLCLMAFWLVYKLLLGGTTFHHFNRGLLLLLVVLSLVLPLVPLPVPPSSPLTTVMVGLDDGFFLLPMAADAAPSSPLWLRLCLLAYVAGISVVLIWNILSAFRLHVGGRRSVSDHGAVPRADF